MDSIEVVFKSNYKELCIISYFYLKDIVQNVFVKLIEKNKWQEIRNPKSYLKTAVRNASLKNIHQNKRMQPIDNNHLFIMIVIQKNKKPLLLKIK